MASFNGTRIPGPMFNQNFSPRNLNRNSGGERQRFSIPPFQQHESFVHGNFPDRPPFSNIRNPTFSPGYRNIPPISVNASPSNVPSAPGPRFGKSYERHFTPWNQMPSFVPPRQPFQNHPRPQMTPGNNRDQPFQNHPRPQMTLGNNRDQPFQNHPRPQMPPGNIRDQPFQNHPRSQMPPGNNRDQPFQNHPRSQMPPGNNRDQRFQNRPRPPIHPGNNRNQPYRQKKQNTREFRKLKEDNIEKAFSCDTCDRAFITDNELNRHLSEHITCDQGNCTFEAHPKIVAIHKKMQHETGYAERISKLKDAAEIQKWREERRSRFPTTENIKKRQAEQAEREARGEVLETKEFGKFKRQRTDDGNPRNRGNRRKMRNNRGKRNFHDRKHSNFQSHPSFRPVALDMDSGSDSDNDSHITLKRFSGILPLATSAYNNHNEEDKVEFNSSNVENDMDQSSSKTEQNLPYVENDRNQSSSKTEQNLPYVENDMDQSSSKTEQNLPKCDSSKPSDIQNSTIADCDSVMKPDELNDKSKEGNSTSPQPSGYNGVDRMPMVGPSGYNREDRMPRAGLSGSNAGDIRPRVAAPEDIDDEAPVAMPIIRSRDIAADSLNALPKDVSGATNSNARCNGEKLNSSDIAADSLNALPKDVSGATNSNARCNGEKLNSSDTAAGSSKDLLKDVSKASNSNTRCIDEKSVFRGKEQGNRRGDRSQRKEHFNGGQVPAFVARKSTLLEKLLANDIRHERNIILQCVRHIVNKNFFGIGGNTS